MVRGTQQITVLMSVYNGEKYLKEAVDSILGQSYADFRFIIVDDASTDSTAEILRAYAAADDRIHVLTNGQNLGLAASLNRGLEKCDTEYVARMDADDIAMSDRLSRQMAFLDAHPDVDVCGMWADLFSEARPEPTTLKMPSTNNAIRAMMLWQNPMAHPTVIFRKSTILRVGGYDATLRYAQDYDLWARLAENTDVQFANMPYTGLCYRTYEDDRHNDYKCTTKAIVSARLLRAAGFSLQSHEEYLHRHLSSMQPIKNNEQLLRLASFSLRIIDWGKIHITQDACIFIQCVDCVIQELARNYYGHQELIEGIKKYAEAIDVYKNLIASLQETIEHYQELEDKYFRRLPEKICSKFVYYIKKLYAKV